MKKMLLKVDYNTLEIHTMGGTTYKVHPGDITICCTWTPTAELEIDSKKKTCTATSSGQTVRIK